MCYSASGDAADAAGITIPQSSLLIKLFVSVFHHVRYAYYWLVVRTKLDVVAASVAGRPELHAVGTTDRVKCFLRTVTAGAAGQRTRAGSKNTQLQLENILLFRVPSSAHVKGRRIHPGGKTPSTVWVEQPISSSGKEENRQTKMAPAHNLLAPFKERFNLRITTPPRTVPTTASGIQTPPGGTSEEITQFRPTAPRFVAKLGRWWRERSLTDHHGG